MQAQTPRIAPLLSAAVRSGDATPYADGFSLEQHKFGPFGPIRAKVQELATASRTTRAGAQDNGSDEHDRAR